MVNATQVDWNAVIAAAVRMAGGEKEIGFKHDSPGTPISGGFMHGPGGLLSYPGVDPTVFSTIAGPMGLLGQLPTSPSVYVSPLYETVTGISAATGEEAQAACDPGPTAGYLKGAIVMAPFGKYRMNTPELDITRLGQRNDRADPMDLQLVGSPIGGATFSPFATQAIPGDVFTNEMSARVLTRNVAMDRKLRHQLWIGSPTNNVDDGYKELTGLETLVATGYKDAITGTSAPAMDSNIIDFNYQQAGGDLVETVAWMFRNARVRALRTGVEPVRWVYAMREEAFWEITAAWPCAYYLGGCTVVDADGQRINIDARDQIDLRDQMRSGRFLLVDGVRIEVVLDDGIPFDSNTTNGSVASGCFASDIYLLPMSVAGRSTLFLEYFDFQNPSVASALAIGLQARANGPFLETWTQTRNCFQVQIEIEPRLVLRTPWLAARLQNVLYCPIGTPAQPFPEDPYFVNGGVQGTRTPPYYYNLWGNGF